jgi:hypothetical protein
MIDIICQYCYTIIKKGGNKYADSIMVNGGINNAYSI